MTYGTPLVDLEQHQPVDVLPDRQAATLADWLRAHPGIEIIAVTGRVPMPKVPPNGLRMPYRLPTVGTC